MKQAYERSKWILANLHRGTDAHRKSMELVGKARVRFEAQWLRDHVRTSA